MGLFPLATFLFLASVVSSTAPPAHFSSSEILGKAIEALGGADTLRAINRISYHS
jgi:hypothetical protein